MWDCILCLVHFFHHASKLTLPFVVETRAWFLFSTQVNSFGSAAQALAVFLLLPGLAALRGINPTQLPQYLSEGMLPSTLPAIFREV